MPRQLPISASLPFQTWIERVTEAANNAMIRRPFFTSVVGGGAGNAGAAPGGGCPEGLADGAVVGGFLNAEAIVGGAFTTISGQSTTAGMDYVVTPMTGWLHDLHVYLATAQPNGASTLMTVYTVGQQTAPDIPTSVGFPTPLRVTIYPTAAVGVYSNVNNCIRIREADCFNLHNQEIGDTAGEETQGWSAQYTADNNASILGTGGIATVTAATTYCGVHNGATQITDANENVVVWAWPFTGTVRKMYITLDTSQPGGGSLVITLRTGGTLVAMADTALSVTMAAGALSGVYTNRTNDVSVTAGDLGSFKIVNNASPTQSASIRAIVCEYAASDGTAKTLMGWSGEDSWVNQTQYGTLFTSLAKSATERFWPCPRDMTVSNPRLWAMTASGPSPSYTVTHTLRKNSVDTNVITTYNQTHTTGLVTGSGSVSCVKGDLLSLRIDSVVASGNPEPRTITYQVS